MKNKCLLNCMPPAMIKMPLAALSVLKSYLNSQNIECLVHYWNLDLLDLQKDFLWRDISGILYDENDGLLVFLNYLSIIYNDKKSYHAIKSKLMTLKPQYINLHEDVFDKHMKCFAQKVDKKIDEIITEVCTQEIAYYGFSASLHQWICASIIASKIKKKYPQSTIIIGGIGTKDAAIEYMENFVQFDYALWGEAEYSLFSLIKELDNSNTNFNQISNLVFRIECKISISNNHSVKYADLSSLSVRPDYHDYFNQKEKCKSKIMDITIPIETSRGCHWNKCHFCYLNSGYMNRTKNTDIVIAEIKYNMDEFNIYGFTFLDNDIINNDINRFKELLDKLILLKQKFPNFAIKMAEVITKGVTTEIIKNMSLAGFETIQIGYESPSNNLLKKINKKNTFASNLLFIKYALIYKINIDGANIICGLLEETEDHIMEAICNLHVYRFFLCHNQFRHNMSRLTVSKASRYYKQINNIHNWRKSDTFEYYLPNAYLKNNGFLDLYSLHSNLLWSNFSSIENYYVNNSFEYKLIKSKEIILYREYINGIIINELEFDLASLDWYILEQTNKAILSYSTLLSTIKNYFDNTILDIEVINTIEDLKNEGLIYSSDDYAEILSIINTNIIL